MVLGKKVAIFDWEWGRNSTPRDGQKRTWSIIFNFILSLLQPSSQAKSIPSLRMELSELSILGL